MKTRFYKIEIIYFKIHNYKCKYEFVYPLVECA